MGSVHLAFVSLSPVPLRYASQVSRTSFRPRVRVPRASLVDPSFVHFAHTPDFHSVSLLLSSAVAAGTDAAAAVSNAAADAAGVAVEAKKGGWFSAFETLISGALQLLHSQLQKAGIPGSYGLSIILFTVGIKTALFPVNYKQMESSLKMQALSPKIKQIQADYKDNPAVMNQMTAKLYKDEDVNFLAGCLPVLLQIPIWIALYRSLLDLAKDNLLNEPFLWLPSLQGPVSETGKGISTWLFPFVDGAPPIGWHDAICYMILPVLLVVSQVVSQRLMQPPSQDPEKQQANAFLKFLPLMIGWFALNVPSGLGVYWMTNNIFTTAQTWFIRSRIPVSVSATTSTEEVSSRLTTQTLDPADGFKSNGTSRTAPAPKGSAKGSSRASRGGKKRRKRR